MTNTANNTKTVRELLREVRNSPDPTAAFMALLDNDELADTAKFYAEQERKHAEERKLAAKERNDYIRALSGRGWSLRDIAEVTGLTHTAVAKILS